MGVYSQRMQRLGYQVAVEDWAGREEGEGKDAQSLTDPSVR